MQLLCWSHPGHDRLGQLSGWPTGRQGLGTTKLARTLPPLALHCQMHCIAVADAAGSALLQSGHKPQIEVAHAHKATAEYESMKVLVD